MAVDDAQNLRYNTRLFLSHVRHICDYLPAPVRKSATRSRAKYRQTEKLIDGKTLLQAFVESFLHSKVKTEASYPWIIKWEIIERLIVSQLIHQDQPGKCNERVLCRMS